MIGSTRAARAAGSRQATMATATSDAGAATSVSGSCGGTPKSSERTSCTVAGGADDKALPVHHRILQRGRVCREHVRALHVVEPRVGGDANHFDVLAIRLHADRHAAAKRVVRAEKAARKTLAQNRHACGA